MTRTAERARLRLCLTRLAGTLGGGCGDGDTTPPVTSTRRGVGFPRVEIPLSGDYGNTREEATHRSGLAGGRPWHEFRPTLVHSWRWV